jgi:hypothetical protein
MQPSSSDRLISNQTAAVTADVAKEGAAIPANQTIAWLSPDRATILAALRALAYVGTSDDLSLVESVPQIDGTLETANQASLTAKEIRSRLTR